MVTTSAAVKAKSVTLFPATRQETEISMSRSHTVTLYLFLQQMSHMLIRAVL
jgi:hypothetical protein